MVIQQLYTNQVVRPRIQQIIDEDSKKVAVTPRKPRKAATAKATQEGNKSRLVPTKEAVQPTQAGRRNAGKQQRK